MSKTRDGRVAGNRAAMTFMKSRFCELAFFMGKYSTIVKSPAVCWCFTLVLGMLRSSLTTQEYIMSVAKVTEIIAGSKKSFEKAIENGVSRASKTLNNVTGAWVESQKVVVENGEITEYRVVMKVTFVLEG